MQTYTPILKGFCNPFKIVTVFPAFIFFTLLFPKHREKRSQSVLKSQALSYMSNKEFSVCKGILSTLPVELAKDGANTFPRSIPCLTSYIPR